MGEWRKVDWDKQPLGIKTDTFIARKLGVTRQRVQKAREARGIATSARAKKYIQKGIDWDNEPLGDVPDRTLATKHGVATVTVIMVRKRRGIPSYTEKHGSPDPRRKRPTKPKAEGPGRPPLDIDWDNEPLGEESDRQIAIKLGVTGATVGVERKKRGIPAAKKSAKYKKKGIKWDDQPLGEVPDQELADKLGVQKHTVYGARKRRGIELQDSARKRAKIDWDNEPLGKEPDKLLALMLGCSVSAVYKARTDRDIPAYRSKPQQWVND